MRLYEWQGKKLLRESNIEVPESLRISSPDFEEFFAKHGRIIVKAQVLGGKRKKQGLIEIHDSYATAKEYVAQLLLREDVDEILLEEVLEIEEEYYLAIRYDTVTRSVQLIFSASGGIDIEETKNVHTIALSLLHEIDEEELQSVLTTNELVSFVKKAFVCFKKNDCKLLEINPVVKTPKGIFAADAKITIDDNALGRQKIEGPKEDLNERELAAREIDAKDYRGVAGKTFVDFTGDIAVLASGGGASLTCMDALIVSGGKPANYVEYSGNPPKEKIRKLTKITLEGKELKGCILVGGTASFTDIYDTLEGFCEGLLDLSQLPSYPIIIRRAGMRDKEAFAMVKDFAQKHNVDIELYGEETPMTVAVQRMVEKAYGK